MLLCKYSHSLGNDRPYTYHVFEEGLEVYVCESWRTREGHKNHDDDYTKVNVFVPPVAWQSFEISPFWVLLCWPEIISISLRLGN